jgi:hypothetical protein
MLDRSRSELAFGQQADLRSMGRLRIYHLPSPPPEWEVPAKHRIDEIYTEHRYYRSRPQASTKLDSKSDPNCGRI